MCKIILVVLFLLANQEGSCSNTKESTGTDEENVQTGDEFNTPNKGDLDLYEQTNATDSDQANDEYDDKGDNRDDDHTDEDETNDDEDNEAITREIHERPLELVVLCTRRYTPGYCRESVVSVWTYNFNLQNCTERLGCPIFTNRENRFRTHSWCSRLCTSTLSNIYSLSLELNEQDLKNNSAESFKLPLRRSGFKLLQDEDFPTLPPLQDSESENEGRPIYRSYQDHAVNHGPSSYDDYGTATADKWSVPQDLELALDAGKSED